MTAGDGRQMSQPGRSWPLGATVYDGGVNFSVYSRNASAVELPVFGWRPRQEMSAMERLGVGGRHAETDRRTGSISPRRPQRALASLTFFPGP